MSENQVVITSTDVKLIADQYGDPADTPIVFLHGGGQTRHSWGRSARELAGDGWSTITVDLRGHGDSDWSPTGDYGLNRFADDVVKIVEYLGRPPVLVGASLGGNSSLAALGRHPDLALGLVLVDVSPFLQPGGTARIRDFMSDRAAEGFADLDEAADAVARYQPHRDRPKNHDGLRKNLRLRNGRWYWHWDPAFLANASDQAVQRDPLIDPASLGAAASGLRLPTLLVRGGESDVLSIDDSARFLEVVPHAEFASVAGAHHMVAGDDNAVFEVVLGDFLRRRIRSRLDLFRAAQTR
ncbi:MAG TPA: alpha/beta hydrolase [Gordonia sp. (in: high G+C Gram-positive bacteria)]|uniref:alpha/beta fold hydrolase n=1 Tax=unclassified Gordonia (in: high G+C Gram-positive bacteria) TaxID=2657482 RepID=UPI000FAAFA06|nr:MULTISPECIES: alpha/beta hydrolase [unclassified Gordonia (in: high G+C Gram-positive bacteria)]RUP39867.1 MAG: alpha/beta hydrolase [Gordonia sp. (in: high G+C Gram-positive bacteria)]HNP56717.1 alpha/beta hydrolase [Gordonia sp. (in: high G+C Gram-positive bacteria)]HRC51652.1 alpha/beta hydrolase [Gordonia sp. (in: high G+C Gram-positive bacteria)]